MLITIVTTECTKTWKCENYKDNFRFTWCNYSTEILHIETDQCWVYIPRPHQTQIAMPYTWEWWKFLKEEMLVSYRQKWTIPNPCKIHIWPKDLTILDPNKNRAHKKIKSIHVDMIFRLKLFQYCFIYNFLSLLTIIIYIILGLADKGN